VDQAVLATARELFDARHYPSVIALVSDALDGSPEAPGHVPLLLLRARAQVALRRDLDAQADLRDIIRIEPQCAYAYRLLGELAARRDEHESAAIFFREALRLDPGDLEAIDWLRVVARSSRPAAAAQHNPAPVAAAGRFPSPPRFANGTRPPDEPEAHRGQVGDDPPTSPMRMRPERRPSSDGDTAEAAEAATEPKARGSRPSRSSRSSIRELPGFGEYLVSQGILTRDRLRAAQAYQRSMRVQLSTAIVTLGLASPQRIEWAAVAHQAHVAASG
jgi:tetratricopeptide (TPR) repeat protein